uniref:Uncharacterized protein n=1 Tax=Arundo donax TaxID=35708 RepID=A0A0A9H1D0_ARUDO
MPTDVHLFSADNFRLNNKVDATRMRSSSLGCSYVRSWGIFSCLLSLHLWVAHC